MTKKTLLTFLCVFALIAALNAQEQTEKKHSIEIHALDYGQWYFSDLCFDRRPLHWVGIGYRYRGKGDWVYGFNLRYGNAFVGGSSNGCLVERLEFQFSGSLSNYSVHRASGEFQFVRSLISGGDKLAFELLAGNAVQYMFEARDMKFAGHSAPYVYDYEGVAHGLCLSLLAEVRVYAGPVYLGVTPTFQTGLDYQRYDRTETLWDDVGGTGEISETKGIDRRFQLSGYVIPLRVNLGFTF